MLKFMFFFSLFLASLNTIIWLDDYSVFLLPIPMLTFMVGQVKLCDLFINVLGLSLFSLLELYFISGKLMEYQLNNSFLDMPTYIIFIILIANAVAILNKKGCTNPLYKQVVNKKKA